MKLRSPFVLALAAGAVVLLIALAPVAWQVWSGTARQPVGELPPPWQIVRSADDRVRALGLDLPGSTLADARRRWGDELQLAVLASPGRPAVMEAYVERWQGGGVTGRLVIATDATPEAIERWQRRSPRLARIDGGARRFPLAEGDRDEALRASVNGLSFLPSSRVDEPLLRSRFGDPGEVLSGQGEVRHWLYPALGLAIAWDAERGRAVMQWVPVSGFESRLRAPLVDAASAAKPG